MASDEQFDFKLVTATGPGSLTSSGPHPELKMTEPLHLSEGGKTFFQTKYEDTREYLNQMQFQVK